MRTVPFFVNHQNTGECLDGIVKLPDVERVVSTFLNFVNAAPS